VRLFAVLVLALAGCAGSVADQPDKSPILRLVVSGATLGEIESCP
jgi:hypothetical protein